MPDFQTFPLFLAAALLVAITPGPGIFYVAARTLAGGRNEGLSLITKLRQASGAVMCGLGASLLIARRTA